MIQIEIEKIPFEEKTNLISCLCKFPCILDRSLLNNLPEEIRNSLDTSLSTNVLVTHLIDTCFKYSYGIERLVEIIYYFNNSLHCYGELSTILENIVKSLIPISNLTNLKFFMKGITKDLQICNEDLEKICRPCIPQHLLQHFPLHQVDRSKLFCILDFLAAIAPQNKLHPLLEFLENFKDKYVTNQEHKQWLDQWCCNITQKSPKLCPSPTTRGNPNNTSEQYLLIDMELKQGYSDSYIIVAWLVIDTDFEIIYTADNGVVLSNLINIITTIITTATNKLRSYQRRPNFTVEFLVPTETETTQQGNLICYEFDHLLIQSNKPLGTKYPVLVRPRERIKNRIYWLEWQEKCETINLSTIICDDAVFWVTDPSNCSGSNLRGNITHVVLLITYENTSNLIIEILNEGIPIAILPRPKLNGINSSILQEEFQKLLCSNLLCQIPNIIKENRLKAWDNRNNKTICDFDNIWNNTTILWDDFRRNPEDPALMEP